MVSAWAIETANTVTAQINFFNGHLPAGTVAPDWACAWISGHESVDHARQWRS